MLRSFRPRSSAPFAACLAVVLNACASAPLPTPVCPSVPPTPPAAVGLPAPTEPFLRVRLQPHADPTKLVHVDVELLGASPLGVFRLLVGPPELLSHVTLSDAAGPIEAKLAADGAGSTLTPARAPSGLTKLAYDIATNTESAWKPLAETVLDDRFIGSGEGLLLLPEGLDDAVVPLEVVVDGAALKAPHAASTWGVGAGHRGRARPRVLRHLTFVAGSMGAAKFDASDGHDEAAWLGSTAFDPRPVAAEIAGTRTAMASMFHAQEPLPATVLFVTQSRPLGSYGTTPRYGGLLVELGPSEPWSAPLRISVAQQLIRPWIGGELWIGPHDAEHVAESYWFSEGVARYMVTRLLAGNGILRPDDVRDVIVGETSVIVNSKYRGKSNAELAALSRTDDTARAHLVARGALYAARINALARDKSKGGWSLETIVLELLEQARREQKPLPASAWVDAVVRTVGPGEREMFARTIERGEEVVLPAKVLGVCFRPGTVEYTAFDLGFDGAATREGKSGEVVGLLANGPAARAGVRAGDVLEADYRDGHAEVPVKLTVKRGKETLHLTYKPTGEHHKGPTWTRVPGIPDERCGDGA